MSYRLEQVNELVKQELDRILLVEADFEPGVLVTIMKVSAAEDLRNAKVYVSVWPDNKAQEVLKKINSRAPFFQQLLIKRLKMHPVPQLSYSLTQAESESQEIDSLIRKGKDDGDK